MSIPNWDWLPDCAECKHPASNHPDKKTNYKCSVEGCTCPGFTFEF